MTLLKLENLQKAKFLERPNRFIAKVEIGGEVKTAHVADTGRLTEIFIPGHEVLIAPNKPENKLDYKLFGVKVDDEWVLINTAIHSKIVREVIENSLLGFTPKSVKAEVKYGDSRLDFLVDEELYIEVKSSNLLIGSQCRFPDSPTARGVKHLKELIEIKRSGLRSAVLILALRECECFKPHEIKDPDFAKTFYEAMEEGVEFYGVKCGFNENGELFFKSSVKIC